MYKKRRICLNPAFFLKKVSPPDPVETGCCEGSELYTGYGLALSRLFILR